MVAEDYEIIQSNGNAGFIFLHGYLINKSDPVISMCCVYVQDFICNFHKSDHVNAKLCLGKHYGFNIFAAVTIHAGIHFPLRLLWGDA